MIDDKSEDFIFRFKLGENNEIPYYEDRFIEIIRKQLVNLMDIIIMTENGEEVKVDGFKLLNNNEVFNIWPKNK